MSAMPSRSRTYRYSSHTNNASKQQTQKTATSINT